MATSAIKYSLAILLCISCATKKATNHSIKLPQELTQELTLVTYNVGNFAKYQDDSSPDAVAFFKDTKAMPCA